MAGKRSSKGTAESAIVSPARKATREAGTATVAKGKLQSGSSTPTKTGSSAPATKATAGSKKPPAGKPSTAYKERVTTGTRPTQLRSGASAPAKNESIMARYGVTSKEKPPTRSSAPALTGVVEDGRSARAKEKPKPRASSPASDIRAVVGTGVAKPAPAAPSRASSRLPSVCHAMEEMQPEQTRNNRRSLVGSAVSILLMALLLMALVWMLFSNGAKKPITKAFREPTMEGRHWSSRLNETRRRTANDTRRRTVTDKHDDSVYDVWDFRRRAEGAQDSLAKQE